jgi:hypothetical protein
MALIAALELAERNADMVPPVCAALQRTPPSAIPPTAGTTAVRRLPNDNADVAALLDRWENSDNVRLQRVVISARKAFAISKGAPDGDFR